MKFFFALILSLTLVHPAYAAKTVSGTVPHPPPLQPAPANVGPNYSHNIEAGKGLTQSGVTNAAALAPGSPAAAMVAAPAAAAARHPWWVLYVALAAAAGWGGWLWYKKQQP